MTEMLSAYERAAFEILARQLRGGKAIERNALRVLVRSRGSELGRDFIRFKDLDLVREEEVRPNFLARLIGVQPRRMVSLTEKGMAVFEGQSGVASQRKDFKQPEADRANESSVASEDFSVEEVINIWKEDAADGVRHETMLPRIVHAATTENPVVAPNLYPTATFQQAKRFSSTDYTEVVGGEPDEKNSEPLFSPQLDGISEILGLLGYELTPAGKLLAASRWADGYADGEVILEILLVAAAHAARLHQSGTATLDANAMKELIGTIEASLRPISVEIGLSESQLTECTQSMKMFIADGENSRILLSAFLADTLRGVAPPAIMPENVWCQTIFDEDPQ